MDARPCASDPAWPAFTAPRHRGAAARRHWPRAGTASGSHFYLGRRAAVAAAAVTRPSGAAGAGPLQPATRKPALARLKDPGCDGEAGSPTLTAGHNGPGRGPSRG